MTKRGIKRGGTVVALGTVAVLATVGVGFASIPSSANNVISACYAKDTDNPGTLRVIDAQAGATCRTNEAALSFNQRGPQGPAGTANVHWARVDQEGRMTAKSSANIYAGWFDTGGYYFGSSGIDLTRCAISVTPDRRHPHDAPVSAEIYDTYSSYTMFYMKRIKASAWPLAHERVNVPFYVSATCT